MLTFDLDLIQFSIKPIPTSLAWHQFNKWIDNNTNHHCIKQAVINTPQFICNEYICEMKWTRVLQEISRRRLQTEYNKCIKFKKKYL